MALNVGELKVGVVTAVGTTVTRVRVDGTTGVIAGSATQLKVGDHVKLRIVTLKADGGFIATLLA